MNKKLVGHVIFYAILLFFSLGFVFGHNGVWTAIGLKRTNARLQAEIVELQHKNQQLVIDIKNWQQYPFYKEQLAREQLQLAYPGDIIYYVA